MQKRTIKGMSIMETAVIIALVAVASIGILTTFGGTVNDTFQKSTLKFKSYQPFGPAKAASPSSESESEASTSSEPVIFNGLGGSDGLSPGDTGYIYNP